MYHIKSILHLLNQGMLQAISNVYVVNRNKNNDMLN